MLALTFADWELIQKLIEQRELQLRDLIESDGIRGKLTGKKVLKEYKQICDMLAKLSDRTGRHSANPPATPLPKRSSGGTVALSPKRRSKLAASLTLPTAPWTDPAAIIDAISRPVTAE